MPSPRSTASTHATTLTPSPVADGLHGALAATFQIYRDTHLAHFNVTGPSFPQMHALFEQQYQELWAALDTIAERLRATGFPVAAEAFAAGGDDLPDESEPLLRHLADGHRGAARIMLALVDDADESGDVGTADLATQRARAHEKHAWMLEATLR